MSRFLRFVAGWVLVQGMAACGGGSGDGLNQRYREGNTWTYDISTTQGGHGSTDVLRKSVTGSVVNPSGVECKQVWYSYESKTDEDRTYYVYQDVDGSSWYCGDTVGRFVINSDRNLSPMYPANPQVGQTLYGDLVYEQEGGYRKVCSASITGEATVEAAGDIWPTFIIEEACSDEARRVMIYSKSWYNVDAGTIKSESVEIPFEGDERDPRTKFSTVKLARVVLR